MVSNRFVDDVVARANRMLFMEGLATYSGHVSVRNNKDPDIIHINPLTTSRGEILPEDVVKVTVESEPVDPEAPDPVKEREIHTGIYRMRPEINSVIHIHPPYATLFGITGTELVPVHIRGSILTDGRVPVLDRPYLITTEEDSDAMVAAMGEQNQLLLRGHGAVVADENIKRAFARAIYLEMNAFYQHQASVLGNPNPLTREEVKRINRQNWQSEKVVDKFWHFFEWKARENGFLPKERFSRLEPSEIT